MTAIPITTYLGTPEPEVSSFGRSSNLFVAEPTTGEVVGSFVEEVFSGAGSLAQDIRASNIRKLERREEAISEADWKDSDNFRSGIKYYDTMTKGSSKILAESKDDRDNRALVTSKASGMQTVAGFGVGFVLGLGEPKNLATGLAATLLTGGVGSIIPSLGRTIAVNTVRGAAVRGGVEGVVAAALTEPSNIESSKIVQGDYTMADSILNMTLGVVLGAGIGGGVKALQIRGAAKKAYRAETDDLALKELDTALAQTVEGSQVDVTAVKQIENIEAKAKAQRELPKIEEKIAAKQAETGLVPVTQRPEFKKWFEGSQVVDVDGAPRVVYHGTNVEFKEFSRSEIGSVTGVQGGGVFWFTDSPDKAGHFAGLSAQISNKFEGENIRPSYVKMKNPIMIDARDGLPFKPWLMDEYFADIKKQGHDGAIIRNWNDGDLKEATVYAAPEPEQIKSIFGSNSKEVIPSERLQLKKGQALSDSRQTIDQAPLTKLKNDISRNDNSTAYDPKSSEAVAKELEEFKDIDDQIRLEQELEGVQEELAELNEQGLLNSEEIKTLERLAEIDAESAIFDNVLLQSKLCLTRG